jgi:hypothetical protein
MDKKRNASIRQELNLFSLGEKKEHQQNYLLHILRIPAYGIPWDVFYYHPKGIKERGGPPKRWKDQFA